MGGLFNFNVEGKISFLKFTKYDCANLPKIFLANNFEKSPTNRYKKIVKY